MQIDKEYAYKDILHSLVYEVFKARFNLSFPSRSFHSKYAG